MNKKFEVGQLIRQKITGFIAQIIEISEIGYHCDNAYVPFTAQDQWELVEKPVIADLKEAACDYEYKMWENSHPEDTYTSSDIIKAFKAGANWQKEKDEEERVLLYKHGFDDCKQQIMKDAIETEVRIDAGGYPYINAIELWDYDKDIPLAKAGDKIKVIIIK